ncbi:unnamed protein product, partial [Didymodactylos carnosus]
MAKALAEATSENVVKFIYDEILITFGCPISVISDRGKAFVSNTLKKYLELQQRHHLHTSNVLMVCLYPCLQNTLKVGHKWGCLYSTSIICMSKPTIPGDTHQPYVYDENNNNDLNEYRAIQLEELGDRHSAAQMGKDTTKEGGGADDTHSGNVGAYQITVDQLQELMELHGKELIEKLNASYGGMKGLLEKLKVDGQKGLQSDNKQDLEKRRQIFGKNEIPPEPMRSFLYLCCQALLDKKLIILLICAVVSIGFSWLVSVAILAVVLVVIFVTGLVDWRRERHFRVMQSKFDKDLVTSVVRDNKIQQIPIQELVVGDLCFIKYGDLLPADGLIVQASDLQIDESSLT